MVPELIPVLGSQPAGDVSHIPGGRLPLLSARPAVTPGISSGTLRSVIEFGLPSFFTAVRCCVAGNDRHFEDRHRVFGVEFVRRDAGASAVPVERQTTDGRVSPLPRDEGGQNCSRTGRLLANTATN